MSDFSERWRSLAAQATERPWSEDGRRRSVAYNDFTSFLVNHSDALLRLVEAAQRVSPGPDFISADAFRGTPEERIQSAINFSAALRDTDTALAALETEPT